MYGEAPIRCIDTRIVDSETIFPALVPFCPLLSLGSGFLIIIILYIRTFLSSCNQSPASTAACPLRLTAPSRRIGEIFYTYRTPHAAALASINASASIRLDRWLGNERYLD